MINIKENKVNKKPVTMNPMIEDKLYNIEYTTKNKETVMVVDKKPEGLVVGSVVWTNKITNIY